MSIIVIQPSEGWVRLVADVLDKEPKTIQCRGEDHVETAVFKDNYTPSENDAGLILSPETVTSNAEFTTAIPLSNETIYGRAYNNKIAYIGVMG